jgi:hypothetical protein
VSALYWISICKVVRCARPSKRTVEFKVNEEFIIIVCLFPSFLCTSLSHLNLLRHRTSIHQLYPQQRWTHSSPSPHPPSSPTSPHRPLTPPILHFSNAFTSITTNRGNGNDTKNHIQYSSSNNCDLSSNIFSSEARRSRTWKVCIITHITKNLYRHVTRMHMHIRWSPRRKWNNANNLADNGRGVSRARGRSLLPPSTQDPYSHSPTFCLCSPHPRSPTPTPTPTLPLLLPTPPRHLLPAGAPMILRVGNDTGGAGEYNP